ncbi:MAG: cytochrome c3 family protein [Nitrospirae bacterium]|nr:cytochrome c3 family protein [Nitrospirota bacterium]
MKPVFIITAMLTLVTAGVALAVEETITLPASNGNVIFHHKEHENRLKDCTICHVKGPGKIEGFNKEWAHKKCVGCHWKDKISPTKCTDCHKKK